MIHIYFKRDPDFLQARTDGILRREEYDHVADVDAPTLEQAYTYTQNLDVPWTDNPRVHWSRSRCERSASVGDVFVLAGQPYEVAFLGFDPVIWSGTIQEEEART